MANAQEKATERVVLLLRPKEKQRLQKLARNEGVSAAEILRRSLIAYGAQEDEEQKQLMAELNLALDRTLANLRASNSRIRHNLDQIRRRRSKVAAA